MNEAWNKIILTATGLNFFFFFFQNSVALK